MEIYFIITFILLIILYLSSNKQESFQVTSTTTINPATTSSKRVEKQLESVIKRIEEKIDYKDTKAIYFETINDKKIAQNERLFLTIIFSIITFLLFYFGISGDFWIGGILGVISGSLMIYYFIEINKRIKYLETEINRLFTIKETSLKELKKLNKYFNQQTI